MGAVRPHTGFEESLLFILPRAGLGSSKVLKMSLVPSMTCTIVQNSVQDCALVDIRRFHHDGTCLEFHPGLDPGQCPSRLLAAHARFHRRLLRSMMDDGHPEGNRMV